MHESFTGIQDGEAKVATKESKIITICKDTLLVIETLTAEVVCIKKHCRAHEVAL